MIHHHRHRRTDGEGESTPPEGVPGCRLLASPRSAKERSKPPPYLTGDRLAGSTLQGYGEEVNGGSPRHDDSVNSDRPVVGSRATASAVHPSSGLAGHTLPGSLPDFFAPGPS